MCACNKGLSPFGLRHEGLICLSESIGDTAVSLGGQRVDTPHRGKRPIRLVKAVPVLYRAPPLQALHTGRARAGQGTGGGREPRAESARLPLEQGAPGPIDLRVQQERIYVGPAEGRRISYAFPWHTVPPLMVVASLLHAPCRRIAVPRVPWSERAPRHPRPPRNN